MIVGVEGQDADHLTTTSPRPPLKQVTPVYFWRLLTTISYSISLDVFWGPKVQSDWIQMSRNVTRCQRETKDQRRRRKNNLDNVLISGLASLILLLLLGQIILQAQIQLLRHIQITYFLFWSVPAKLETSCTVILPPTVSVLWLGSWICQIEITINHLNLSSNLCQGIKVQGPFGAEIW